jgi:hypothetical protein
MNEKENISLEELFDEIEATVDDNLTEIKHNTTDSKGLVSDFEELKSKEQNKEEDNKQETEHKVESVEESDVENAPEIKVEKDSESKVEKDSESKIEKAPEAKTEKIPSIEDIKKIFEEENRRKEEERLAKEKAELERIEQERIAKEKKEALNNEINFDGSSVLTEEEKKVIKQVEEDYPEIKKVLDSYEKKTKAVNEKRIELYVRSAVEHVFNEITRVYGPLFQDYIQQKEQVISNRFREAHPDFNDDMSKDLQNWINSYPENLKKGLENAFNGNIEDKIKVVEMYKQFKGIGKVSQTNIEPAKIPVNDKKIEDKKKALSPVNSKTNASKMLRDDEEIIDKSKLFDEV